MKKDTEGLYSLQYLDFHEGGEYERQILCTSDG